MPKIDVVTAALSVLVAMNIVIGMSWLITGTEHGWFNIVSASIGIWVLLNLTDRA